jgi:hypothetical protein
MHLIFLPLFPVVALVGLIISLHFGVRIRNRSGSGPIEIIISKYSYVGIEKNRQVNPALAGIFEKLIQLENYIRQGDPYLWLLAKFSAEKEMWSIYESRFRFGETNTFDEYVRKLIIFIEMWFGDTGCTPKYAKQILSNPSITSYSILKEMPGSEHYIWFSYQHGN